METNNIPSIEKLNKVTKLYNSYKRIIDNSEYRSFHTKPENIMARPEYIEKNKAWVEAVKDSEAWCDEFMSIVRDPNDADHPKKLALFYSDFKNSEKFLRSEMQKSFIERRSAYPPESQNTSYENSVLNNYVINTKEDAIYFDKFRTYIKAKWKAVGYLNDEEFISDFWEAHPPLKQNRQTITDISPAPIQTTFK